MALQSRNDIPAGDIDPQGGRDSISAWRVIIGFLLALPMSAGVYGFILCKTFTYAFAAWSELKAISGH